MQEYWNERDWNDGSSLVRKLVKSLANKVLTTGTTMCLQINVAGKTTGARAGVESQSTASTDSWPRIGLGWAWPKVEHPGGPSRGFSLSRASRLAARPRTWRTAACLFTDASPLAASLSTHTSPPTQHNREASLPIPKDPILGLSCWVGRLIYAPVYRPTADRKTSVAAAKLLARKTRIQRRYGRDDGEWPILRSCITRNNLLNVAPTFEHMEQRKTSINPPTNGFTKISQISTLSKYLYKPTTVPRFRNARLSSINCWNRIMLNNHKNTF